MIKLNVLALLKEKGKSKYWLYKQLGNGWKSSFRFRRWMNFRKKKNGI